MDDLIRETDDVRSPSDHTMSCGPSGEPRVQHAIPRDSSGNNAAWTAPSSTNPHPTTLRNDSSSSSLSSYHTSARSSFSNRSSSSNSLSSSRSATSVLDAESLTSKDDVILELPSGGRARRPGRAEDRSFEMPFRVVV